SLGTYRYYSTKEVAKLLRVNESTVRRWANSGKLKCFKTPGSHRKYTARQISEFLDKYQYELL
ncbi:MAG TPA: helix-turn-helix domain-containing protein, partial [Candidatus Hodarchaeales archaeon]|nr:helix-turn-helix domain-containing protein [Candidatus Hodarchaeales archaeon]